jgi:hypothetical protein
LGHPVNRGGTDIALAVVRCEYVDTKRDHAKSGLLGVGVRWFPLSMQGDVRAVSRGVGSATTPR